MKKFLLFMSAAVAISAVADAAPSRLSRREARRAQRTERRSHKAAESKYKWLPGKVETFTMYEDAWQPGTTMEYKYSTDGLLLELNTSDLSRTVYEYDSYGREISYTNYFTYDGKEVPQYKNVREYDSVVKDFEIAGYGYNYDEENKTFVLAQAWKTDITRDGAGNVTKVQGLWYDLSSGKYEEESDYYTIAYSGGKASEIKVYEDGKVYATIKDIVWESTDGQILEPDYDDEDFFMGANRIKSATILDSYYNNSPLKLTAEYPDDKGSYRTLLMMGDTKISSLDYKVIDGNGSYEEDFYELDFDYDEETDTYIPDVPYRTIYKEYYDSHGLNTKSYTIDYEDGEKTYESFFIGKVTYDPAYGYPTEYMTGNSQSGSSEDDVDFTYRQVFSNYVKVAGVADVTVNDADAPVEYFNLQGIRVAEPSTGLYIRRQGSKTEKVFVR